MTSTSPGRPQCRGGGLEINPEPRGLGCGICLTSKLKTIYTTVGFRSQGSLSCDDSNTPGHYVILSPSFPAHRWGRGVLSGK